MALIAGKRIAISGAGVGGTAFVLALEQACKSRGISPMPIIKLFERDNSPFARENLGYSFSIREGLPALYQLKRGIIEKLVKLGEPGNAAHFCWQTSRPLIKISPDQVRDSEGKFEVLRIMRTRLRQTLLGEVPKEYLHYGKICTSATPAARDGQPVQLSFADGSREECDLLVVADGANSKLRSSLMPSESKRYAGVCMLFVRLFVTLQQMTDLAYAMLGRTRPLDNVPEELLEGLHLVLGKGNTTLFMGTVDKNTVTWSLSSKVPQSKAAELNALFEDAGRAQKYMEQEVPKLAAGFGEPFPTLLQETEPSSLTAYPATDKLPHPFQDNGIVYIGDAWHPMSPFAGAGADMALLDALELAQQLTEEVHESLQTAIDAFAASAEGRSTDAIKKSYYNIALAHSDGWKKQLFVLLLKSVGNIMRLNKSLSNGLAKAWFSAHKEQP